MISSYQEYINLMNAIPGGSFSFVMLAIWSLIWKGIALWKAARSSSKPWYVALLVINTVGLLEILYIFFFSKKKGNNI